MAKSQSFSTSFIFSVSKILVLKNDRGGDLVSSIRLINKLAKNNELTIYLSEIKPKE